MNSTTGKQKWFLSVVFLCLLGAVLAAVVLALPLMAEPGLLNTRGGGDSPFLLQRLHQLETALRDGHFPVRWMPDANYGYGYPFYNFYAPLSIYITAVFRFFGFSFVRAIQLSQLAGFVAAAWGMFALARRWFGAPWAGLLASVAYSTAPFHMVNVYVRGDSLAEFWAMAFYPLVLLAVDWLLIPVNSEQFTVNSGGGTRRTNRLALFALTYGALILSHNISALIFSPFLLLYVLLKWVWRRNSSLITPHSSFLWLGAGLLLALGLAAWFFIPALAEQSLAQLGTVTEGYFHYSNHFRGTDLVQRAFAFDYNVDGGNAFRMGLVQGITAVSGLIILLFWRKGGAVSLPVRWFILLSFLVATFMMTPLSRLLWEHLPLLSFTQFPWRFLSVQAFFGALAAGGLALLPSRRWLAPALSLVLSLVLLLAALGNLQTDHLLLTDADVTARKLVEYEWYTGNIGSTVSAEYLPQTVQPRPTTSAWLNEGNRDRVVVLAGAADVTLVERKAIQQRWSVAAEGETTLIFPTMAWPGWLVEMDGEPVDFQPAPGSGLIQVTVPPGEHLFELRLTRTPVRLGAELVSLTAVLILMFLLLPRHWKLLGRKWGVVGIVVLLLFVTATWWSEPELTDSDLNWDFAQMAYLHHEDGCIPFTDSLCLEAYQYSGNTFKPGETLTIETRWSGSVLVDAPEVTVALYSPAITRPPILAEVEPPAVAIASDYLSGEQAFVLTLPDDVPPGLFVPRLVVAGHQALTPSGLKRGDLFLRPVQVLGADVALADPRGELDADVITAVVTSVLGENDLTLDLHLAWFTAQPLTHNYNVSLRLTDANGQWLRQLDTQPGFGFLPSSMWSAGEWTSDWLALRLPELYPAAGPYPLIVQLYDVAAPETATSASSGQAVLTRRLGVVQAENGGWRFQESVPNFDLPAGIVGETATSTGSGQATSTGSGQATSTEPVLSLPKGSGQAVFGDEIKLLGYELEQDGDFVTVTLHWQALANGQTDYTRFVQLLGAEPGQLPLRQNDSYPVFNTYPTSQWAAGEVVADVVVLDLAGLPAGDYQLVVGFYERLGNGGIERVTAVDEKGSPIHDNTLMFTKLKIEEPVLSLPKD